MNRVRLVVPALCVIGLFACSRDRSGNPTVDRDLNNNGKVDLPAAPLDREHTGLSDKHDGVGTTTVTGANVGAVQNTNAIEKIVAARCAREMSCKNVGADKRFTSNDVCGREIRNDMKDDLNSKDCPYGVDQKELNECLDSIKNESCGNPLETISRLAACRTSDMCLRTAAPNR